MWLYKYSSSLRSHVFYSLIFTSSLCTFNWLERHANTNPLRWFPPFTTCRWSSIQPSDQGKDHNGTEIDGGSGSEQNPRPKNHQNQLPNPNQFLGCMLWLLCGFFKLWVVVWFLKKLLCIWILIWLLRRISRILSFLVGFQFWFSYCVYREHV
jgi:hypothetical protein